MSDFNENYEEVSLESLKGGALPEMWHNELTAVLKNIADVNTELKFKRSIMLKVEFSPHEDRRAIAVKISTTTKLAPKQSEETFIFAGKEKGKSVAYENNPDQQELGLAEPKKLTGDADA